MSLAIHAAAVQGLDKCSPDLLHAAIAATFCDEASARFQRAVDGGDHRVGALDPVQHRVAEDGIELRLERQRFAAHHVRVESKLSRGLNLRSARIHGDDFTPQIDQLFREHAVSATQVQNALAGLRRQQLQDGRSQI